MFRSTSTISRRGLLKWGLAAAGTGLLVACGQQAPSAPAATSAPAAAKPTEAAAAPKPAQQIAQPTPPPAAPAAQAAPAQASPAAKPTEAAAAKPAANAQIKRGGSMKLHRQNEWPTLDPHTAQTNSLDMILTYDYLTRVDLNQQSGAWEVKPGLA